MVCTRLPIRVSIVALYEVVDALEVLVQEVMREIAGRAIQNNMLVNLDIACVLHIFGFEPFIAAEPVAKEPHVPARIPAAMLYPAPEKDQLPVDIIAIDAVPIGDRRADLVSKLWRDTLVRIDDQDPFVGKGQILEGPVSYEDNCRLVELDDFVGKTARELYRPNRCCVNRLPRFPRQRRRSPGRRLCCALRS